MHGLLASDKNLVMLSQFKNMIETKAFSAPELEMSSSICTLFSPTPTPLSEEERSLLIQRIDLNYALSSQLITTIQSLFSKLCEADKGSVVAKENGNELLEGLKSYRNSLEPFWEARLKLIKAIKETIDQIIIQKLLDLRWLIPSEFSTGELSQSILHDLAVDQDREFELKRVIPTLQVILNRPIIDQTIKNICMEYTLGRENIPKWVLKDVEKPENYFKQEWNHCVKNKLYMIHEILKSHRKNEEAIVSQWTEAFLKLRDEILGEICLSDSANFSSQDYSAKTFNQTDFPTRFNVQQDRQKGVVFYTLFEPHHTFNDQAFSNESSTILEHEFVRFSDNLTDLQKSLTGMLKRLLVSLNETAFKYQSKAKLAFCILLPHKNPDKQVVVIFSMGSQRFYFSHHNQVSEISPKGTTPTQGWLGEKMHKEKFSSAYHLEVLEVSRGDLLFFATEEFCRAIDPIHLETPYPSSEDPDVEKLEATYGWGAVPDAHQKVLENSIKGLVQSTNMDEICQTAEQCYTQACKKMDRENLNSSLCAETKSNASLILIKCKSTG